LICERLGPKGNDEMGTAGGRDGAVLKTVRSAMKKLAKAYKPKELADHAYSLYEHFRPDIPAGKKGWGAKEKP
jgi:hypothetical protein